jgi:hypothetical protein
MALLPFPQVWGIAPDPGYSVLNTITVSLADEWAWATKGLSHTDDQPPRAGTGYS